MGERESVGQAATTIVSQSETPRMDLLNSEGGSEIGWPIGSENSIMKKTKSFYLLRDAFSIFPSNAVK